MLLLATGGGVPRRERLEGWVGAWRKMGGKKGEQGEEKGSGRSRYRRHARAWESSVSRGKEGGEDEWRGAGIALLTAASSRLESSVSRGKGGVMVGVGACAISGGMLTLGTALGVGKREGECGHRGLRC